MFYCYHRVYGYRCIFFYFVNKYTGTSCTQPDQRRLRNMFNDFSGNTPKIIYLTERKGPSNTFSDLIFGPFWKQSILHRTLTVIPGGRQIEELRLSWQNIEILGEIRLEKGLFGNIEESGTGSLIFTSKIQNAVANVAKGPISQRSPPN